MKIDTVRAWKDDTYRESLSEEQLCSLPANPAGELDLTDTDLESVSGGWFGPGGIGGGFGGGCGIGCGGFGVAGVFGGSAAFVCANQVFSISHVRNVVNSAVLVRNFCIDFN